MHYATAVVAIAVVVAAATLAAAAITTTTAAAAAAEPAAQPPLSIGVQSACQNNNCGKLEVWFFYNNTGEEPITLLSGSTENFVTFNSFCWSKYEGLRECHTDQPQPLVFLPGYHVSFKAYISLDEAKSGAAWTIRHQGVTSTALVPHNSVAACPVKPSLSIADAAKSIKSMFWS